MSIEEIYQIFLESTGVATDTRSIKTNQLFFALKGDNFNGNSFAAQALQKGAAFAILDEEEFATDDKLILVDNVLKTLQDLATYHRRQLNLPVLAITGSNGKTTSKELIHAVIKKRFNAVATQGNLNNHIGVPLTLLSFTRQTEFGIVEMGANHHLEIKALCEIAQPDFGYITNFGKAHLEGFGSVEGVIKAKSELYDYLKANNKLIFLNADDNIQKKHLQYEKVFSFGQSGKADVMISYPSTGENAQVESEGWFYDSQLTGSYNAVNVAAAICIGTYFKISTGNIQKAIAAYSPQNNRSQLLRIGSTTLLMDAYNANPTSMMAALESFGRHSADLKAVILGDMFELGKDSEKEHQDIINHLENTDFNQILLVGRNFYKTRISAGNIQKFQSFDDLQSKIKATDFSNTFVLVKGSRGMALERIVNLLKEKTVS